MANTKISALPAAGALDGTEIVPVVDAGVTKRTTVAAIAGKVDLSNYQAAATLIKSDTSGSFRSTDGTADVEVATGGVASITGTTQVTLGSAGSAFVDGNEVHIVADGGAYRIDMTNIDGMDVSSFGVNGSINIVASDATGVVNILGTASASVQGKIVTIASIGANGSLEINALGTNGAINVRSDTDINLFADNLLFNGGPIGGATEVWVSGANFSGNGSGFESPGGTGNYVGYDFPAGQNRFAVTTIAIPAGWTSFSITYFLTNSGDANLANHYILESTYQLAGQGTILDTTIVSHPQSFLNAGTDTLVVGVATPNITAGGAKILNYRVRSNNATQEIAAVITLIGLLLTKVS